MASMEHIFQRQAAIRKELGLTKVKVHHNKNYKRNGTKSYVYLLNKFGFQPTMPGPYGYINKIDQRGLSHPLGAGQHVGGRVHYSRVLVKHAVPVKHDHMEHWSHHHKKEAHKAHHHHSHGEGSGSTGTSGRTTDPTPTQPSGTGSGAGSGAAQTGQVTAEDQQNDSEYLCEVQIGTPAQTLLLDFDTGSSDLWIFSTELPKSDQSGHTIFNPAKSSTFKTSTGQTWQISYGDGSSASGTVGTDNVTVGGLAIKSQCVELAKTMAAQFSSGTGDGLLGLAWSSINTVQNNGQADPQNTPVTNMIAQEDIPQEAELFTAAFYSTRDVDSSGNQIPCFYTFGYIDQDLVTASGKAISWATVDNSNGFWQIDSETCSVNGKTITQSGNTAIMDTGTTLCMVSDEVCTALYGAIKGATYNQEQQGWTIPTSVTADQLPTFTLGIGNTQFTIQKEDLLFAPVDANTWYGGVQSRGNMTFDIFGDVVLKSIYAIWDQGNTRFGAVPKLQSTQNITPPSTSS